MVEHQKILEWANNHWEESIIPSLSELIQVKALSPSFDPDWKLRGELHETVSYTHLRAHETS